MKGLGSFLLVLPAVVLAVAACAYWHGDYGLAKAIDAANEIGPDDAALVLRLLAPPSLLPVYLCSADGTWKMAIYPGVAAARPPATAWEAKNARLNKMGYFFVLAKPGDYALRLLRPNNEIVRLTPADSLRTRVFANLPDAARRSLPADALDLDTLVQSFAVPANKLLYRGTVAVRGFLPPIRTGAGALLKVESETVKEEDTLKAFAKEFPDVYAIYENRIVR